MDLATSRTMVAHVDVRQEPVVGGDEDEPLVHEHLRLDLDVRLVARLPAAAVNPEDHGQVLRARRRVDVEHLPLVRRLGVGDVALDVLGPRRGDDGEDDEEGGSVSHGLGPFREEIHGREHDARRAGLLDRLAGRLQTRRSWRRSGTPPRCSPACSRTGATSPSGVIARFCGPLPRLGSMREQRQLARRRRCGSRDAVVSAVGAVEVAAVRRDLQVAQ